MDRRILESVRLMERRMGEAVLTEDLADAAGLSLHHFHRMFVDQVGEPPAAFLRRIRMESAALRLQWSDEPASTVAHSLGFRSRPAFIRAFEKRYGKTPAQFRKSYRAQNQPSMTLEGHRVGVRDVPSFHLLAKRYVGNIFRLGEFWDDFFVSLPDDIPRSGNTLYVGLLHDDFRLTDPEKVRYDCAITVDQGHEDADGRLAAAGLYRVDTAMGSYATIDHSGPCETVPATYDLLCGEFMVPKGLVPGPGPAIEINTPPRRVSETGELRFTILFPLD